MPCWFSAFLGRSIGDFPLSYFACRANKHQGGILDKKAVKSMSLRFPTPSSPGWKQPQGHSGVGFPIQEEAFCSLLPLKCFPRPCQPSHTALSIMKSENSDQNSDIWLLKKRDDIFGWLTDLTWLSHKGWPSSNLQTPTATGWIGTVQWVTKMRPSPGD